MHALLLASFLMPATASGATHVLIAGGAVEQEPAKRVLAQLQRRAALWAGEVSLAGPVLVESARVPGLKPGFQVVIVGRCQEGELAAALPLVKAFEPGAYARAVGPDLPPEVSALSCPATTERWVLGTTVITTQGGRRLRVVEFAQRGDPSGPYRDFILHSVLTAADGTVLQEVTRTRDEVTSTLGLSCEITLAQGRKGTVVVNAVGCARPRGCPVPTTVDGRVVIGIGEDALTESAVETRRHSPPCAGE